MVPVDLGHIDKLDRALKTAADLAAHYGAKVTYVGVTSPQPGAVAHSPEEFAEKLARFAAGQTELTGIEHAGSQAITVHDPSVDLIVMGSHIPKRLDLGSHGGHLAALTHRSVMLVRDAA
jgi:nucleotide-binding universal stress UspA family protein